MSDLYILVGDGRLGCPQLAPYDAIHVGAASPTVPQAVCSVLYFNIAVILLLAFATA